MDERLSRSQLIPASVGAALAAIAFPDARPGLNVVLVGGFVMTAAIASAERPVGLYRCLVLALAGSLLGTAVFTSATWVIAICVVASIGLVGHALRAGTTASESTRDLAAVFLRVPLAVGYWVRPLTAWLGRRTGRDIGPLARGTAITGVLMCTFGLLFVSADAAFARIAEDLLNPSWDFEGITVRATIAACVLLVCGSMALTAASDGGWGGFWAGTRVGLREPEAIEWLLPLGFLNALFAAFVTVQFTTLFGGHHYVLQTSGLTYSEYAREGFFQLIVAAGLTLLVMWATRSWSGEAARGDARQRFLLSTLGALTLVVLASALARLALYEEAFGTTRARVSAHVVIVWLAAILTVAILGMIKGDTSWMPRTVICLSTVVLVVAAMMRPDALIADRNVARYLRTGKIDVVYLSRLSVDAVPALTRLDRPLRDCALGRIARSLNEQETWLEWNLARSEARLRLGEYPVDRDAVC